MIPKEFFVPDLRSRITVSGPAAPPAARSSAPVPVQMSGST
jgi:hypothetical protein